MFVSAKTTQNAFERVTVTKTITMMTIMIIMIINDKIHVILEKSFDEMLMRKLKKL